MNNSQNGYWTSVTDATWIMKAMPSYHQNMVTFDENQLINNIYGNISNTNHSPPPDYFLDHAILAPHNTNVQKTNEKILSWMPGDLIIYHSANTLKYDDNSEPGYNDLPQDLLHALQPSLMPLLVKAAVSCTWPNQQEVLNSILFK